MKEAMEPTPTEKLIEVLRELRADAKLNAEYYMTGYVNLQDIDEGFRRGYRIANDDLVKRIDALLAELEK